MTGLRFSNWFTAKNTLFPRAARDVVITDGNGALRFKKEVVETPSGWSSNAAAVLAYLYLNRSRREQGAFDAVGRIAGAVSSWGIKKGWLQPDNVDVFESELSFILLDQYAAFSSPIWMNLGIDDNPSCSSCYIVSVHDNLEDLAETLKTQVRIFKSGGGCGLNLSPIRSSRESLKTGIGAPGPVEFMKALASFSKVIRSGGRPRSSSTIFLLDVDHPDVVDFVKVKRALNGLPDNCIYSVRISDRFMKAALGNEETPWALTARTDGRIVESQPARALLHEIADAALGCGEPGVQFSDTINRENTCSKSGSIDASNPCGEFLFLEDCAATLASLNLFKFVKAASRWDVTGFCQATSILVTSLDIILDNCSYPTTRIGERTLDFRPVLIGYTNLATALLAIGLPYDSMDACRFAAAITSLMTSQAYLQSCAMAQSVGPFPRFEENREVMLQVLARHRGRAAEMAPLDTEDATTLTSYAEIVGRAQNNWEDVLRLGEKYGLRNAQVTAIAPTGTISLLMDCESSGIEPKFSLFEKRRLQDGGILQIEPRSVPLALRRLKKAHNGQAYSEQEVLTIVERMERGQDVSGVLATEHAELFAFALASPTGKLLGAKAHLNMVKAAAPHVSGGISKTILLPKGEQSPEESVCQIFADAWRTGIKGVTVYKVGSKEGEPVSDGNGGRIAPE